MPALTYSTGTVSVTPGSRQVAGIGTLFMTSQIREGDIFELGGLTMSIASVDSNIGLTLVRPWPGVALSGQQYEVRFSPDAVRVMAAARTIQTILASGNLASLANVLTGADQLTYFTGPGSVATTPFTNLAREIVRQPTAQAVRTLLGLSTAASAGIRILGAFPNMAGLPTTGRIIGDAYLVNGTLQLYNGSGWTNAGPIVGPAGLDGMQIYTTRAAATNGAPTLQPAVSSLMIRTGVTLEIRQRTVTTPSTDPLFPAPATDGWGITLKMNLNDTFVPITDIAGTANAITGTFGPALTNTTGTRISFVPVLTNTGAATLNAVQLRDMDGNFLTAGALIPGRTYLFERMSTMNAWRMIVEPFGRADAQAILTTSLGSLTSQVAALQASVGALGGPIETVAGPGGVRAISFDAAGNAQLIWRENADPEESGHDLMMCRQFYERGAAWLGGGGGGGTGGLLSTTAYDLITVNGQSLSVGGEFLNSLPAITRAQAIAAIPIQDAALMLTGTFRADFDNAGNPVPIVSMDMPRSQGYNKSIPATGLTQALPSPSLTTSAWPMVTALNAIRRDLGVPMVPVISQVHGVSGISADEIDDDITTGTGATTVWENAMFVLDQAVLQAAAAGRQLRVPFHALDHGTSAQSWGVGRYLTFLWQYGPDYQAAVRARGILGAAIMLIDQCGGNANTTLPDWHVVDEQLQFCEQGGGILTTPQYAYEIADDNVHPDAHATMLYSETRAWCVAEVERGNKWTIERPRPQLIGNQVILNFDSLRQDEYLYQHSATKYAGRGIDNHLGFQAEGTTIQSTVVRGKQVVLTCASQPTGIRYAYQKQDVRGAGNRFTAHRGLMRTSLTRPSVLLPGQTLYRWSPSYKIAF